MSDTVVSPIELVLAKLQARRDQLLREQQRNTRQLEQTQKQLGQLQEAQIGFMYAIGELERQISEFTQMMQEQQEAERKQELNSKMAAELEAFQADANAAAKSDTEDETS